MFSVILYYRGESKGPNGYYSSDKEWSCRLVKEGDKLLAIVVWGKRGKASNAKTYEFYSAAEANKFCQDKTSEKLRKGYKYG